MTKYKKLVWGTLNYLEKNTLNSKDNSIDLRDNYFKEEKISEDDMLQIRRLLLTNGLISLKNETQWNFQLTAAGMLVKESDLTEEGLLKYYKTENFRTYKIAIYAASITALISTILTIGLSYILPEKHPQDHKSQTIVKVYYQPVSKKY